MAAARDAHDNPSRRTLHAPTGRSLPLGLGKLYRRTGKREHAREHLTTAATMFREMGMTYWLEKGEDDGKIALKSSYFKNRTA